MKFENENEMIMWMLAFQGFRYNGMYKNLNDDAIFAANFADKAIEEFRKRMPDELKK